MKHYSFVAIILLVMVCSMGCNSALKQSSITPRTDTVWMHLMKFQPAVLTVNTGDTVVWINRGIVKHNVTAFPGKEWTSGKIPPDSSWKMVITVTASLDYYCSIHPTMKGKIKIRKP